MTKFRLTKRDRIQLLSNSKYYVIIACENEFVFAGLVDSEMKLDDGIFMIEEVIKISNTSFGYDDGIFTAEDGTKFRLISNYYRKVK